MGGQLTICQPRSGYRAGVDPVFLAASVDAQAGQTVLDLGCGVGVAALCLGRRVPGVVLSGLELQADYAELARQNARENEIPFKVLIGDIARMPSDLRAQSFDHVIVNPPYFSRADGTGAQDSGRDIALAGATPLARWIDAAIRRLRPRGYLTMIHKADRLADIVAHMDGRLGDLVIKPLAPRVGRDAELIIIRARKGARGAMRLAAPLILHQGDRHEKDGESYGQLAQAVLRNGAPLEPF